MLPTPSTSHVSFDTIYEPAEDSFLLLDTLSCEAESSWLQHRFPAGSPTPVVAEIGTGSGVVIAFLAAQSRQVLGRDDMLTLGVDVNMTACKYTDVTVQKALLHQGSSSIYLGSVCADLCSVLVDHSIDVLVFNPPYVSTAEIPALSGGSTLVENTFDRDSRLLSLSYAGGKDGMETTDRLLDSLQRVLTLRGAAYVLMCAQNRPEAVKSRIRNGWNGGWHVETVGTSGKAAGWEKLEIVRIWRD